MQKRYVSQQLKIEAYAKLYTPPQIRDWRIARNEDYTAIYFAYNGNQLHPGGLDRFSGKVRVKLPKAP